MQAQSTPPGPPAARVLARVRRTGSTASLLAAVLVLGACLLAGRGGYQLVTLESGSMAPTHPAGSLMLEREQPAGAVSAGQVITYRAPTARHPVLTHRVTSVRHTADGTVSVRTRGDANPGEDPWDAVITDEHVWLVVGGVPRVGAVLAGVRDMLSPPVGLGCAALLALAVIWVPPRRGRPPRCRPHRPLGGGPRHWTGSTSRAGRPGRRATAVAAVAALTVTTGAATADAAWSTVVARGHAVLSARLAAPSVTALTDRCVGSREQVTITWASPSDDRLAVRVERRTYTISGTAGAWSTLVTLPATATRYADPTTAFSARYGYRITHTAGPWAGAPSTEARITTFLGCSA